MTDPSPISDRSGVTDAVRVQILATEHWSLLATRSMTWNEIFSRASMFVTVLSATVVALALVAQATNFGQPFRLVALLLLPVVFLVGFTTVLRLGQANREDFVQVAGMNRLRHAYLELAPELEPYFITGFNDDLPGVMQTYGWGSNLGLVRVLSGTPNLVAAINVVVAGVFGSLLAEWLGVAGTANLAAAAAAAIAAVMLHVTVGYLSIAGGLREHKPHFPH